MFNKSEKFNPKPAAFGSVLRRICSLILRFTGWKYRIVLPETKKFVIIAAPHTTSWDFIIMFLVTRADDLRLNWVGKDSLFKGPFSGFFRWLGGIKVNRRTRNNFVQTAIEAFVENDQLMLVLAPEGTRSKTKIWKSGFYHIAMGAKVPILLASVDYPSKFLQADQTLMPTGNVKADMDIIRKFYAGKRGKHADQQDEPYLSAELEETPQKENQDASVK